MRTTVTLDDDVLALIDTERRRTGEPFRIAINRMLRQSSAGGATQSPGPLPELPGKPLLDISDVSEVLAALDDERREQRHLA